MITENLTGFGKRRWAGYLGVAISRIEGSVEWCVDGDGSVLPSCEGHWNLVIRPASERQWALTMMRAETWNRAARGGGTLAVERRR